MNNQKIIAEKEEKIDNLNKTIDSLTKENQNYKIKILNLQTEKDELNRVNEEQKKQINELSKLYKEEKQKNDMMILENQVKEKETIRVNQGKMKESNIDMNFSSFGDLIKNNSSNSEDNETNKLKQQIETLENENMELRKNLELKEMESKDMVSKNEFQKIENQNFILKSQLEEQEKQNLKISEEMIKLKESINLSLLNNKDNTDKGKKYSICLSYVKQVLDMWKPNEDKEQFIFNKLKKMVDEEK